jgi:hypothetical protein
MRHLGVSGSRCNELERLRQQFANEALYSAWVSAAEYFQSAVGQRQLQALLNRNGFSGVSELARFPRSPSPRDRADGYDLI